jgi:NAD(P)-dependent dehydrogenase (short-subunit alcohol dehydrogenase family)
LLQDEPEQHAVVTGATRGIGAAIAIKMAQAGYRVSAIGRDSEKLDELSAQSDRIIPYQCDLTDDEALKALFERIGSVNILVNNAGAGQSAPFLKSTDQDFVKLFDVNVLAAVRCARYVLADMQVKGYGRIINIASTAGQKGYPYVSAYCASKHAMIGLTRSLALEFAKSGITINAICPGYTDTDIVRNAIAVITEKTGRTADEALAEITKSNPQGRLIQPGEVAALCLYLCSPAAGSITGQSLGISGGEVM